LDNTHSVKKLNPTIFQYIQKLKNTSWTLRLQIINPPIVPDEPPWHLKEYSVDMSLINCGKKQDNPQFLKASALEKNRELIGHGSYLH